MNCICTKAQSDSEGNCTVCGGNLEQEVSELTRKEEDLDAQELKIFTRAQTLKQTIYTMQDEIAFLESFLPPKYREKIRSN